MGKKLSHSRSSSFDSQQPITLPRIPLKRAESAPYLSPPSTDVDNSPESSIGSDQKDFQSIIGLEEDAQVSLEVRLQTAQLKGTTILEEELKEAQDAKADNFKKSVNELFQQEKNFQKDMQYFVRWITAAKFPDSIARDLFIEYGKIYLKVLQLNQKCFDEKNILSEEVWCDFAKEAPGVYGQVSRILPRFQDLLNSEEMKGVVKEFQKKESSKGCKPQDYIAMPIQHIPRYVLLLKRISDSCEEDHPLFITLKEILLISQKVADQFNEARRIIEMSPVARRWVGAFFNNQFHSNVFEQVKKIKASKLSAIEKNKKIHDLYIEQCNFLGYINRHQRLTFPNRGLLEASIRWLKEQVGVMNQEFLGTSPRSRRNSKQNPILDSLAEKFYRYGSKYCKYLVCANIKKSAQRSQLFLDIERARIDMLNLSSPEVVAESLRYLESEMRKMQVSLSSRSFFKRGHCSELLKLGLKLIQETREQLRKINYDCLPVQESKGLAQV